MKTKLRELTLIDGKLDLHRNAKFGFLVSMTEPVYNTLSVICA